MAFWEIVPNLDGSFTMFEDPLGDFKDSASLGVVLVISIAVLVAPVFANPAAFAPALACFLLALILRFFFGGQDNFFFLCPLLLPFAVYAFVSFADAVILNEEGELVLVAFPVVVGAAILFGLLISKLMAEDPGYISEFSLAMVSIFGLVLGISVPLAAGEIIPGRIIFYALRVLYLLTLVLLLRALVIFLKMAVKGKIDFGAILQNLVMFAVGCGVYIVMCILGAIFGKLSGLLCIALFVLITLSYYGIYRLIFKREAFDTTPLRFILLPTALIFVLNCFCNADFTVEDDLIYGLSDFIGNLHILPWLAGLSDNVAEGFAALFAGAVELLLRLIEMIFDCNIGTPHLSDFAGMLLGIIALAVAMLVTRVSVERAERRREYRRKMQDKTAASVQSSRYGQQSGTAKPAPERKKRFSREKKKPNNDYHVYYGSKKTDTKGKHK